jgi:hypothetical protein
MFSQSFEAANLNGQDHEAFQTHSPIRARQALSTISDTRFQEETKDVRCDHSIRL